MSTPITLTGTVDGANATFTATVSVVGEEVFLDRLLQDPRSDYTLTNGATGATLVFTVAPVPFVPGVPDTNDQHIQLYGTPVGVTSITVPTVSRTGFGTAGDIINRVAVQCGLASVTDPFASTDPNFVQLCELLSAAGADLQDAFDWSNLIREATITTAGSVTSYALPADWDRMVDGTEWNRSTRYPLLGPLSGQEVQFVKAYMTGVLVQVAYRIQGTIITFPTTPSNGITLAYEYITTNWAWSAAGSAPDQAVVDASTDTVCYDRELTILSLKLMFLEAKGFDTTDVRNRYQAKLEQAIGKSVGSRLINIGGVGVSSDRLIDASNLPITGY